MKNLLVTGGTGSFGKHFIRYLLENYKQVKRIVIYSRDELKQFEMKNSFNNSQNKKLRFFIGDVRDKDRLNRACENVDTIVHAAALKQVPTAEYNPFEAIKTNIIGAQNVIEVALDRNIKNLVALSTDKACSPINLYGATKLCSDKLFIAARMIKGNRKLKVSVVRYGNVFGSRGSVVPFFLEQKKSGILEITDKRMTRFNMTLNDAVKTTMFAIDNAIGGEIFVKKNASYKILDLAKTIGPKCKIKIIGIRQGEKIHEELVSSSDSYNTRELGEYFVILPNELLSHQKYLNKNKFIEGKSYNSLENHFLNPHEIKNLIKENI